ncbi:MAG: [protein-PII] uridylyltransferase [Candidatus Nanopelagicales bacterium]
MRGTPETGTGGSVTGPAAAYAAARTELLGRPGSPGPARRRALVSLTDEWLGALFTAAGGQDAGAALAAVGGYGRGELAPGSDLDLLLLHRGGDVGLVADRIWYPVWDAGLRLDHSVRTVPEARRLASQDLRVVLGLLDVRLVAGDASLVEQLRTSVLADWRALAAKRLAELRETVLERVARQGELAYLLEPDLKESYGGLRDTTVLRAVAASWVTDAPRGVIEAPHEWLLDVRDALHTATGRPSDRLLLQEQDAVAALLGLPDSDALLRRTTAAGRSVAYASEATWHRVARATRHRPRLAFRRLRSAGPERTPLAEGVVVQDGEAVLAADARPERDPVLPLRAAAAAAQAGIPLAPHTVDRLAAETGPMPVPWPREARESLVSLLGAGRPTLPVWEALDQAGLVAALLPGWDVVRSAPQRNPVHRFTVDRHLVETAVEAAARSRRVPRPDLLLVGALLHDIGKGRPGDHTDVGVGIVADLAPRMGFDEDDTEVLVSLVRHHLLLPEAATRRDLDDPATVAAVAEAVGSHDLLDLLHALTEADAAATGPAAWSDWKRSLVDDLVARTHAALAGRPEPPGPRLTQTQLALADGTGVELLIEPGEPASIVTVAAPDRIGLLAAVAGVLALHRLEVRAAQAETIGDRAVQSWTVVPVFGDPPPRDRLREDLRRALDGSLDVPGRLAERERAYRRADAPEPPPPVVRIVPGASQRATVLEVRAHDVPGLLHRVARALAAAGVGIAAARVSTLGSEVVDVFYLVDLEGRPLSDDRAAATRTTVLASLGATP